MNLEIYEVYPNGFREAIPPSQGHDVTVIMPAIDLAAAVLSARRIIAFAGMPCRMIIAHDFIRQGFVKTINMCANAIQSRYVAYVAQDSLAGQDWLKFSYHTIRERSAGLCAFNDGKFAGGLASFGLVCTEYADCVYGGGNIFFEGYHAHRADDELTNISHLAGKLCYNAKAIMMEVDHRLQRQINRADVLLYEERKIRFPAMAEAIRLGISCHELQREV